MGKETFYDLMGIGVDATTEEIKKRYKVLALKYHPDKNLDNVAEANQRFSAIKEAYNVLSEPKERAWYDRHKEAFHGDQEVDVVDHSIDEAYFTTECYSGYNDTELGFYTVYRNLFDEIIDAEEPHRDPKADDAEYPRFGNSNSDLDDVKQFYDMWQSFNTAFTYAHLDRHDIREAPNRRIVRLMEKENKKIRDEAKKNRNALIQELVQFVRKKDKRMDAYRKRLEAKVAENRKKSENHRLKVIEERNKAFEGYVESEWVSLQGLENELKNIEATSNEYYKAESKKGKNKKNKKNRNQNTKDDDNEEEGQADSTDGQTNGHSTTQQTQQKPSGGQKPAVDSTNGQLPDQDEDDEEEEEEECLYCEACNKKFKTINSFQNHEKSKKHLQALERYNALLAEQDEDEEEEEE